MKKETPAKKPKQLKVSHKHRKPYRKRHYAVLVALIALGVALLNTVYLYQIQSDLIRSKASDIISDEFGVEDNPLAEVTSRYGFKVKYDSKLYIPNAVVATGGEIFTGESLKTPRDYGTIRLLRAGQDADSGSITFSYYPADLTKKSLTDLESTYIFDTLPNNEQLSKESTEQKTINGVVFQRTAWKRTLPDSAVSLSTKFVTYTGIVNGSPFTTLQYGVIGADTPADDVPGLLDFSERTTASVPTSVQLARADASRNLLDKLTMTDTASAAAPSYTASERISATYGPAVVKVYNVAVGDLAIDGKVVEQNYLAGGTGSGFIVSNDGYVATNGHVAVNDPRDEIVKVALEYLTKGNQQPFLTLIAMTKLTDADFATAKTSEEVLRIAIKAIYDLPASRFGFVNQQQNLLVGLGSEQVDVKTLVEKTQERKAYGASSSVKDAVLAESDYEGIILPSVTGEFSKSDVALLKMTGDNFPMVQLGEISDVDQGSNINIMGFPGIGSSNGLVSETKTSSTLTTGKVSSKKTDTGGKELIETDTEIGHGNSGGPAFNDSGDVIGIATYSYDPGGSGDGTLNYLRDIADLKSIADQSKVNYSEPSSTQALWNKGIDQFYTARYKKAVANFEAAKKLYPEHPRADALIALVNKRIANGENVDDFPVAAVAVVAIIVVIGLGVTIVIILMHKKKHVAYKEAVLTGQAQPMVPGAAPQYVPVATPNAQVFNPNMPQQQPPLNPQQNGAVQPQNQSYVPPQQQYAQPAPYAPNPNDPTAPNDPSTPKW